MTQAAPGNTVLFHYKGTLSDGQVFESSDGRDPLRVTLGQGEVIQGVDQALSGMEPGEKKKVTIRSEEAYGPHRPELVQEVERAQVPPHVSLEVGNLLEGTDPSGRRLQLTVIDLDDDTVTLDANHPLAGQDLTFELKVVEVV
jgi:peptidylprolyl isomerase